MHFLEFFFFYSCTMHLDAIKFFIYPTDARLDCSKRMSKFTLIYIKNAPTCFGLTTIIRELPFLLC